MDRGYIYLNKKSFIHNLEVLKNLSRKELCLVVKANAYGHGPVSYTHLRAHET